MLLPFKILFSDRLVWLARNGKCSEQNILLDEKVRTNDRENMNKTNKYEGLNVYYIMKKGQKKNLCPDPAAGKLYNSTVKFDFRR